MKGAGGDGLERGRGDGLELRQAAAGEMGGGEGREERWTRQRRGMENRERESKILTQQLQLMF